MKKMMTVVVVSGEKKNYNSRHGQCLMFLELQSYLTGKKQRYLIIKSSALKRTFQVH